MQDYLNLKNVEEWAYLINKLLNNREISTENEKDWKNIMKYSAQLKTYFEVMSYDLIIDDNYGFAYLKEFEDLEVESLSKKQKLSFWTTLFLCILREYIYKKEQDDVFSNSFIITLEEIKQSLWDFLKEKYDNDEKKVINEIQLIINKTRDLWVLSEIWNNRYKINKTIKAKLSVEKMEEILFLLKNSLEVKIEEPIVNS